MIVITQACIDPKLIPLGIVYVSLSSNDDLIVRLDRVISALKEKAPKGTTHLFNVKFDNLLDSYFLAYADAYTNQPIQEGTDNADSTVCGASDYFG